VHQQACPLWVPLIEQGEHEGSGADYFVQKDLQALFAQSDETDLVLLACTHYPLLEKKIRQFLPAGVELLTQGQIVASSLANYLDRHPEMEQRLGRSGEIRFFTTDEPTDFDRQATAFYGEPIRSNHLPADRLIH